MDPQVVSAEIVSGAEVVDVRQDPDGVNVQARTADGVVTWRAAYAVGADGLHSTVRRCLGLPFPGHSVIESMMLADVRLTEAPDSVITVNAVEQCFAFVAPYGDGWYRIFAWDRGNERPDTDPVDFAEVRDVTARALGTDLGMHDPRWLSRFHSDERQVRSYRVGRVFLAGDAAHVHSPAGAQGMNTGLQDAASLSWKLAAAVQGWASDGLLDSYHAERHPVGRMVMRTSGAIIRLVMIRPWVQRTARNLVGGTALRVGPIARRAAGTISGVGIEYPGGDHAHAPAGKRAEDILLAGDGRRPARLYELLPRGSVRAARTRVGNTGRGHPRRPARRRAVDRPGPRRHPRRAARHGHPGPPRRLHRLGHRQHRAPTPRQPDPHHAHRMVRHPGLARCRRISVGTDDGRPAQEAACGVSLMRAVSGKDTVGGVMPLDEVFVRYLNSQSRGRLSTVGPDGHPQNKPVGYRYNADLGTIDIGGFDMEHSAKYRNIGINPHVAFVVDDAVGQGAPGMRFLEVRGEAEQVGSGPGAGQGLSRHLIRVHPRRLVSLNIDPEHPGMQTRDVAANAESAGREPNRPTLHVGGAVAREATDAVGHLVAELQTGWDRHDADLSDRHVAADVMWGSPFGATVHAYEQLHAIHVRLKRQARGAPAARFEVVRVLAPAPDMAVAQVRRVALDSGGEPVEPSADVSGPFSEMALYVLVRRGATWWLAAGQNTPIRSGPSG